MGIHSKIKHGKEKKERTWQHFLGKSERDLLRRVDNMTGWNPKFNKERKGRKNIGRHTKIDPDIPAMWSRNEIRCCFPRQPRTRTHLSRMCVYNNKLRQNYLKTLHSLQPGKVNMNLVKHGSDSLNTRCNMCWFLSDNVMCQYVSCDIVLNI